MPPDVFWDAKGNSYRLVADCETGGETLVPQSSIKPEVEALTPDDMTSLLMSALESQCNQDGTPRLLMIETDDLSSVSIEGSFDIRAIGAEIAARLPRALPAEPSDAPGRVDYGEDGELRITIAPGALGRVG